MFPGLLLSGQAAAETIHRHGRRLEQDTGVGFDVSVNNPTPSMFGLDAALGISQFGAWAGNFGLNFTCVGPDGPYAVGPDNPDLCIEQIEATMSSELFGNVTVAFNADQLGELRSVSTVDPSVYVYGLPLSKYAVPNAYYESASLNMTTTNGERKNSTVPGWIFNQFNASVSSLRGYYNVDPSLQGSNKTLQGSTLWFGLSESAVNTTAASEYLELQGLVPNVPLQLTDWAPENDVSVCELSDINALCGETQMDVEAQQAFAPQAITYFAPTEVVGS
jgi:hypothetical protein